MRTSLIRYSREYSRELGRRSRESQTRRRANGPADTQPDRELGAGNEAGKPASFEASHWLPACTGTTN